MSPAQQRGLALWAALLSAVVCLWFLPASRLVSVLVLLAVLGLIMAFWAVACRRVQHDFTLCLEDLPEANYCRSLNDPERQKLMNALNEYVAPFSYSQPHPVLAESHAGRGIGRWLASWPVRIGLSGGGGHRIMVGTGLLAG